MVDNSFLPLGGKKVIFSLLGFPGSGKGTLAKYLSGMPNIKILYLGNLIRKHIKLQTFAGLQFENYINSARWIPDELVSDLVFDWLHTNFKAEAGGGESSFFVFDGYPRNVRQVKILFNRKKYWLKKYDFQVVYLNVSDIVAKNRLKNRFVCSNENCQSVFSFSNNIDKKEVCCVVCGTILKVRKDDSGNLICKRLGKYKEYISELLRFYEANEVLINKIDVIDRSEKDVFEEFINKILII